MAPGPAIRAVFQFDGDPMGEGQTEYLNLGPDPRPPDYQSGRPVTTFLSSE